MVIIPFVTIECGIEGINEKEIVGNVGDVIAVIVREDESVCKITFQFVEVSVISGNPVPSPFVKHDVGCGVIASEKIRETCRGDVEGSGKEVELDFPCGVNDVDPPGYSARHVVACAKAVNVVPVAENSGERQTEDED